MDVTYQNLDLYNNTSVWRSLTGNQLADDFITSAALFIAGYAFRTILAILLYYRKDGRQERSYWAVSRVALYDGLTRRLPSRSPQTEVHEDGAVPRKYTERNRIARGLAIALVLVTYAVELALIFSGLPARRPLTRPIGDVVNVRVRDPGDVVMATMRITPCMVGDQFVGTNVEASGRWMVCSTSVASTSPLVVPAGRARLIGSLEASKNRMLQAGFFFRNINFQMTWLFKLELANETEATIEIKGSNKDVLNYMKEALKNRLDGLGGEIKNASLQADQFFIEYDYRDSNPGKILPASFGPEFSKEVLLTVLFQRLLFGSLAMETNVAPGSRVVSATSLNVSAHTGIHTLGYYNGPNITALGSIILAVTLVIFSKGLRIFLAGAPDFDWEIKTSFGRYCCDKLLTGPNEVLPVKKTRDASGNAHLGYGVPNGHTTIANFDSGEAVS